MGLHDPVQRKAGADLVEQAAGLHKAEDVAHGLVPGPVTNVDVSVVCEAPRLGPHREQMQRNLSAVLGAPVSVKASSNEGMGWVGRGEGIACVAVVLIGASA